MYELPPNLYFDRTGLGILIEGDVDFEENGIMLQ